MVHDYQSGAGHRTPRRFATDHARPNSARFWSAAALCRFMGGRTLDDDRVLLAPSNAPESGAGAPHSKTLRAVRGRVVLPPGFGVRQPSAAFRWNVL
jgi:hypothetical protein